MNATVIKNIKISERVCELWINVPELSDNIGLGQSVNFLLQDCVLAEPLRVCEIRENGFIRVVFKINGCATKTLSEYNQGESINVFGPYGKPVNVIEGDGKKFIVISDGQNVYSQFGLLKKLNKNAIILLGFEKKEDISLEEEFVNSSKGMFVATVDGSCGYKGNIASVLQNIMKSNEVSAIYADTDISTLKKITEIAEHYDTELIALNNSNFI